jgi:Flp pilus assembly protein TadG
MRQRLQAARKLALSSQPGQIIVMFAVFLIVLMVLAGSAYDYASIVVDDAKLQNAVDASLLAGSDALSKNIINGPATAQVVARATTTAYLNANGVVAAAGDTTVNITFPVSTPAAGMTPLATPVLENIRLDVTRNHATAFWPLVGIPKVNMVAGGSAHAARGLIDVMLSLDTTNSMSAEFPALQGAVSDFVDAMNPSVADPRSPRVGLARWQGETCTDDSSHSPRVYGCQGDYSVLIPLTGDAAKLKKLATNNPLAAACPNGMGAYACPIDFHSPGSGTKLPNGIYAVDGVAHTGAPSIQPPYAWTTADARNNNPLGSGWAKKILIMMTDGENNDQYDGGSPPHRASKSAVPNGIWDQDVVAAAVALEAGPNATIPEDDVEIYVINFQCGNGDTFNNGGCTSKLASRAPNDRLCPGPMPAATNLSNTDTVLIGASSSKTGTCDHYYPLAKNEDLPGLFLQLAGTISRGALTE